jgi:serine protease
MTRIDKKIVIAASAAVAVVVATTVGIVVAASGKPDQVAAQPLAFRVDSALSPALAEVAPVEGKTQTRAVGAFATPDGSVAELVTDEVIVHVKDQAELDAFLGRWGGEVLDSFPADEEGQDHLVRVDAGRADPAGLAGDLLATEPNQSGEYRVSDERVLRLLALAAAEWKLGTEVVIDWLTDPVSIESGVATEADDINKNVFEWSFMQSGAGMDTGVAAAWQLLQAHGKLTPQVRYMVVDGGFARNFDFPDNAKIRKADWGDKNPKDCTGGSKCPYHGTDVALAAMAKVDNQYGTAGPAGPVVSELIAVGNSLDYWSVMRRIEAMAEEEHPDVVNLSFTRDVNAGSAHAKKWTDRRMKHVRDTGALIVAAAGNNGRTVDSDTLFVPCESTHVMCVGGMNGDAKVSDGSNFGEGDSPTSVEIYGPMCVRSINDPNKSALDFTTRQVCGTSVASPFVGGVAALIMAANPALNSGEVRKILNDTANVGGLGSKVTGSQRRVNALKAVAHALGVPIADPAVVIQSPGNGKDFPVGQWVDLKGKATDFMGRDLTPVWSSDRDGNLGEGKISSASSLSEGTHVITATATDSIGRTGSAKVTIKVVNNPPKVQLVSPANGLKVLEGNNIALVATSVDPDNYSPVPNEQTSWEIKRGGTVVHTATGHSSSLPANKVTPGSYTVKFTAAGASVTGSFTVTAIPPGQHKPVATITKPDKNLTLGAYNGAAQNVAFTGAGTDQEDGAVAGTRYRWTAYSGNQVKTLCVGSSVPGTGNGGIVIPKNCASFTGQLGLAPGDIGSTTWTVWLEVFDASGLVGTDTVNVQINFITG